MNCGVPQGSVLVLLLFLLYINDIKHAIGCDNVKLFAIDTFLFTNDRNIYAAKEKASNLFEKKSRWCVANQLSINSEKTNFVLFHTKNKPIPEHFDCIQTTFLTIDRVKFVQYLGLMIDENLYWHMHAEYVYNSLVKYFDIFNHVKTIISKKIARQLYFAFMHSRIKYGIEVFGDFANEYLQKLQVIQNKLLKLLLNFDHRMSTNEIHQQLSLLKVVDIHTVNVLSFVNECRCGRCPICSQAIIMYEKQGTNSDRMIVFMCLWQEPISVKVLVKSKVSGYGIISSTWLILICIKKKLQIDYHETLYWNLSLNLLHLITVCVHALLLSWYHTYLLHVVS